MCVCMHKWPLYCLPAFPPDYAARVEASMAGRSLESSQECVRAMKPPTETGDKAAICSGLGAALSFCPHTASEFPGLQAREREMTRQLDKFEWKKGTDPKNPEVGAPVNGNWT